MRKNYFLLFFALIQIIHESVADSQAQSKSGASAVLNWQIKRKSAGKETLLTLELRPRTIQEDGKSIGRVDAIIGGSQELVYKRLGFWDGIVKSQFKERRKDGRYKYGKIAWRDTMREHRAYKKKLKEENKL